jgi:hypothetical protein
VSTFDDLERAQTYRVDTHDGRIGSVAAVLPRADGRPGYLLVHSGLMRCALSTVPFSEVEEVDAERRRVLLRDAPRTMRGAAPNGDRNRIVARA